MVIENSSKHLDMPVMFLSVLRWLSEAFRLRLALLCGATLFLLGADASVVAQDNAAPQPSARQQLQHIHSPQSIDQELARLTKDLAVYRRPAEAGPESASGTPGTKIRRCSTKIRKPRGRSLPRRFTPSATKLIARSMLCLPPVKENWKRPCSNGSIMAKKTGDLLRLALIKRRTFLINSSRRCGAVDPVVRGV